MSPARKRAHEILREHGPLPAAAFARLMWPDSPAWKRRARRHDGIAGASGAGLIMSAGAFLRRMVDDGLAYHSFQEQQYKARCLNNKCHLEPGHLGACVT